MNAKKVLVVIAGVIVIALAWLGYQWFRDPGHQAVPLHPPDTMVQKDAGELGAAVKSLEALAQDAARSIVQAALKDDYLSAKEEREAPNSALAAAEEIKSRAPFPAVVEGFTFKSEDGSEMKVAGRFGLIQDLFDSDARHAFGDHPFDHVADPVSEDGHSNGRQDRDTSFFDVGVLGVHEGIDELFARAQIPQADFRIHRDHVARNARGLDEIRPLEFILQVLEIGRINAL